MGFRTYDPLSPYVEHANVHSLYERIPGTCYAEPIHVKMAARFFGPLGYRRFKKPGVPLVAVRQVTYYGAGAHGVPCPVATQKQPYRAYRKAANEYPCDVPVRFRDGAETKIRMVGEKVNVVFNPIDAPSVASDEPMDYPEIPLGYPVPMTAAAAAAAAAAAPRSRTSSGGSPPGTPPAPGPSAPPNYNPPLYTPSTPYGNYGRYGDGGAGGSGGGGGGGGGGSYIDPKLRAIAHREIRGSIRDIGTFSGEATTEITGMEADDFVSHAHKRIRHFFRSYPEDVYGVTQQEYMLAAAPAILAYDRDWLKDERKPPSASSRCPSAIWYERNQATLDSFRTADEWLRFFAAQFVPTEIVYILESKFREMDIAAYECKGKGTIMAYLADFDRMQSRLLRHGRTFSDTDLFHMARHHFRYRFTTFEVKTQTYRIRTFSDFRHCLEQDAQIAMMNAAEPAVKPGIVRTDGMFREEPVDSLAYGSRFNSLHSAVETVAHMDTVSASPGVLASIEEAIIVCEEADAMCLIQDASGATVTSIACHICKDMNHLARDCPKWTGVDGGGVAGSGNSVLGQRFGTAQGYREGDDPATRCPRSLENGRRANARAAARLDGMRSKRAGGKQATHARRLRTGNATHPPAKSYVSAFNEAQLHHIAEQLTQIEAVDDEIDDNPGHAKSE